MARTDYFIVQTGQDWTVRLDSKDTTYPAHAEALQAAIDAALASGQGFDARVLVKGFSGLWQPEWVYGRDPFPPKHYPFRRP